VNTDKWCPECGSDSAFEVKRSESQGQDNQPDVLFECSECGAVWESYLP
jgi:uncharacterized Zn finger protein